MAGWIGVVIGVSLMPVGQQIDIAGVVAKTIAL